VNSFSAKIRRWRPGAYFRASSELFGWLLLRALAQITSVVVLARALGAEGYGLFVTVLALASFFPPLVLLGTPGIVLRDGARLPEALPALVHASVALWARALLLIIPLALGTVWLVLPQPGHFPAIAALVAAEILSGSLTELVGRAEQARHRTRNFGLISAGLILTRLIALGAYLILGTPSPHGWMLAYAAASLLFTTVLWGWMKRRYPTSDREGLHAHLALIRDGLPFFMGAFSFRLQAEFNKPVLAQLGYAEAGQFGLAQRAIDLASLPLVALQETLWPRVFVSPDAKRRLLTTGAALVGIALCGGAILVLLAPWLPRLLGNDFKPTAEILMWLAGLPAVQVMRRLSSMALVAERLNQQLSATFVMGVITSIISSLLLIPGYGLKGAVIALFLSEISMTLAQISIYVKRRRS
jgi:O-antigen/teichoic acid export membrane protein